MSSQNVTSAESAGERDVVLEVRNASVFYRMKRGTAKVLDDVSIDVYRGETLGIVGESGSGKSMFASALLDAVVHPGVASGDIRYFPGDGGDPVDVLDLSEKELKRVRWERISMVFQGAQESFNPTLPIGEHFVETLENHDVGVDEGMERAEDLLTRLHLDPDRVLDSYAHELSGGMKQRTLIALSLLLEPEVLVLDEPTAALDLLMQRSILSLLEELRNQYDLTLIFISHDLPHVAQLSDRLVVMYAFGFIEQGDMLDVITNASHPYTRALLNSTPNLSQPYEAMRPIDGESPDPIDVPNGCAYHPRCPLATEECRESPPPMFDVEPDHTAACYHWEDAVEAIPLTIEVTSDD